MKNFTNNLKQFTSRLSARWLIMALMMLVGTSSAWADMCIKGSWDNLNCHNFNDNTNYSVQLTGGNTYEFQIHDTGYNNDQNNNYGCDATMTRNSCTDYKLDKNNQSKNCKISADVTGTYIFKYVGWDNGPKVSVVYPQDPTVCETYTVAGTQGLCGANWDPTASKNDMKCNKDGTYTITFTGISAGKHEFKICKDYGWGTAYPSNNYVYEFTEEGTYDVTITFDKNNNNSITVSKTSSCTDPKASNFTYTAPENLTYNNETKAATVVWEGTQGGNITVKYSSSSTKYTQAEPKDVGTYYVYVTTTEANGICGVTDLYIGKSFTITKANQTTPTITENSTNICGKEATFAVSGGESTGDYSYTFDKNDANATREGTTLKATQSGSVTLKVKKLGDTNYNDSDEAVKEFNFTMPIENVKLAVKSTSAKESYCKDDVITLVLTYDGPTPNYDAGEFEWILDGIQSGTEFIGGGTNGIKSDSEFQLKLAGIGVNKVGVKLKGCNDWVQSTDENSVNVTVNSIPNKPSLNNPNPICYGQPITLPEKDNNKKTITWNVNNRELTNLSVDTHTYKAKIVENGCESTTVDYTITVKEQLAKPVLKITNVKQCGSNYTAGKIVISNHDPNNTYILKKDGNPINKAYNDGYSVSENEKGTYTVEVSKDGACGATSDDVTIEVINNTPTVTPFEITKQANVCMGNPVTLSYDGTAQSGTISYAWYEGDSEVVIGTESTLTIQQAKNASYKLVVTVTSNDCPASDKATTTVEPKAVPSTPTFDEYEMDACVNQQFTLPTPNNLKNGEEALWTVEGKLTTASQTIDEAGEYRYIAYKNDGCPSEGTPFTVRVNPLPTISISGSEEAVLYEDVMLTATATADATVKWYEGGVEKSTGATYVVTSETATSKAVTAKAFLNGCESAVASHTVVFSAENCNSTTTTEQQTVGKTKIIVNNPHNWTTMKCYAWRTSDEKKILGEWSGTQMTKNGNNYEILIDFAAKGISESDNIKVIFNNGSSQTVDSENVSCNKIYRFSIGSKSGDKYSFTSQAADKDPYTEPVEVTVGPKITVPAVKITSAAYNENTGKIDASGAVYKTGCGEVEWGFQYSTDGTTWNDNNKVYPTTHKTNTVGAINHTFEIPGANGGDIYYIRAYAKNSHSEVPSEISIPVEIPSSTIESATISLVDSEGKPSDATEVCPQSTVYLKVSYVGGDYKEFEATENFPGTNLEEVRRDKLDNYAIFSFIATSAGTANITISNNNSSVTPATGVAITLKDVETITTPAISMDPASGMICSDGEATITIYEPNANYTYALYKDSELADDESKGSYTVNEAGSYTVVATESVCGTSASSMAIELKVVSSDVNLVADPTTTSPWQPIKLTVTPPAGYDYTLEGINDVEYTQNGDVYTVKIPRPETWQAGNSGTTLKTANKIFTAKIKVSDTTSCGSKSVTVKLTDTEENCQ